MKKAKNQAFRYARGLPDDEGWPPFLVAVDVGYCIDLYADFARQGKNYVPFPDPSSHRIFLEDLRDPEIRERLRAVFTEPLSLDPTRRSTRVTRELAEKLAKVAASMEQEYEPDRVAGFLMRCLFTMFAEDVELLPPRSFTLSSKPLSKTPEGSFHWFSPGQSWFSGSRCSAQNVSPQRRHWYGSSSCLPHTSHSAIAGCRTLTT